jgi:nucleotide-binding universal stress UspA family protein
MTGRCERAGSRRMARPQGGRRVRLIFQTILIGYDGRERGGEATALAEVLRDPYQGRLLLTSAYPQDPRMVGGFGVSDETDELGDATEAMLAEAREALPDPARAQIRAVLSDSPARALSEVAEAEHADLIVVGSSRRSALGRPLPGTTAERLLQDAPCTVAVAPRGYSGRDIRRIGVAYDGSREADTALRAAESLALELSARLTIYCAAWPSRAAEDGHSGLVDNAAQQLKPETLILHGVPAEEVAGRAYGVIDLLLVGSRSFGPLRRALLGNVSGAVVREAGCPVVVTPPRTAIAPRHAANAPATVSA